MRVCACVCASVRREIERFRSPLALIIRPKWLYDAILFLSYVPCAVELRVGELEGREACA